MKKTNPPSPSYSHDISALFYLLFLVLALTLGLAILFYPETFLFWQHAFSNLGDDVTINGYDNLLSRKVYTGGMILESFILFKISTHYKAPANYRNRTVKRWLAVLGGFGFITSTLPNNRYHIPHSIGTGMVVGALYFFTMLILFELKGQITPWHFAADVALVQLAVFPYAAAFFLNLTNKQSLQKFCIMGLFFVLLRAVSIAKYSFEPKELLPFRQKPQH